MGESIDALAKVASEAVQAPGVYLREAFRAGHTEGDYDRTDVKALADREAQSRIQTVVERYYPDHAFDGEESGDETDHRYRWVVDPLDGTNNFASGYPKFASAVAVLDAGTPVVAAIYEPVVDSLYVAKRGQGATFDGTPVAPEATLPLEYGTVALVIGLSAVTDPVLAQEAEQLELRVRKHCKRVIPTWAPCVDWGLVARGSIEGLVGFHPDTYEYVAGSLLAAESGIAVDDTVEENGQYVGAVDRETTVHLAEILDEL